MKTSILLAATLVCAAPLCAQPANTAQFAPTIERINGVPFALISPAQAAALLPAKMLVFHLREVTLRAALLDLQKQSGVSLELADDPALGKLVSLDLETRSFQDALRAITGAAGLATQLTQREQEGGAWRVVFGDQPEAVQTGDAPFQVRILAVQSNFYNAVKPRGEGFKRQRIESANVQLVPVIDLRWPLAGHPRFRFTRAEDEMGRSLLPAEPDPLPFTFDHQWLGERSVEIAVPNRDARALAHLEGVMLLVLAAKREHWEVPDALRAAGAAHEFKSNGETLTVSMESVRRNEDGVIIGVEVSSAAPFDEDGFRNPLFSNGQLIASLRLKNAKGQVLLPSYLDFSGGDNDVTINLEFAQRGLDLAPLDSTAPLRLIFDAPVEWVQAEIPFAFENVPLP